MSEVFEERPSDSPFVTNFSYSLTLTDGVSTLPADGHWYLFLMTQNGKARVAVGGPITKVIYFPYTEGTEWIGMRFTLGTYMPHLPAINLLDNVTFLPEASSKSFWLHSSSWQFPDYQNIDTFADRLIREELLVRDPVVNAALQDHPQDMSLRSLQRRFLHVTGVTRSTVRQIERARQAAALLQQGKSIMDTVYEAGYFDQPHLTRSLKRFMGQTPAQISPVSAPE